METIKDTRFGRTDVFTEVDVFPWSYEVWNIGRHNFPHPCCIPLARPIGEYNVSLENLKFIKVETEELALEIMRHSAIGTVTREVFDKICKSYRKH